MDKLSNYRRIIQGVLSRYIEIVNRRPTPDVESVLVVDEQGDNYLWMDWGWVEGKRRKKIQVYVRLRNGKFWIEEDWTEEGIATDLLDAGVPNEDIVLAFHEPELRPYTEFAAA